MMSDVLVFPDNGKGERDQVTDLKEQLVEEGIFSTVSEIPTHLVIFMLQHWQQIYDAGYWEGLYKDNDGVLH